MFLNLRSKLIKNRFSLLKMVIDPFSTPCSNKEGRDHASIFNSHLITTHMRCPHHHEAFNFCCLFAQAASLCSARGRQIKPRRVCVCEKKGFKHRPKINWRALFIFLLVGALFVFAAAAGAWAKQIAAKVERRHCRRRRSIIHNFHRTQ